MEEIGLVTPPQICILHMSLSCCMRYHVMIKCFVKRFIYIVRPLYIWIHRIPCWVERINWSGLKNGQYVQQLKSCISRESDRTQLNEWISNCILTKLLNVITNPCPISNGNLAKSSLKIRHGWMITSHRMIWYVITYTCLSLFLDQCNVLSL